PLAHAQLLEIHGLPVPDENTLTAHDKLRLEAFGCVRLFLDAAGRRSKHPRELRPTDHLPLIRLCQKLNGLPLASELDAAMVGFDSLEDAELDVAAFLDDHERLAAQNGSAPGGRQDSLEAVWRWSVQRLTTDQRELLIRLAVFESDWSFDNAVAVCG